MECHLQHGCVESHPETAVRSVANPPVSKPLLVAMLTATCVCVCVSLLYSGWQGGQRSPRYYYRISVPSTQLNYNQNLDLGSRPQSEVPEGMEKIK